MTAPLIRAARPKDVRAIAELIKPLSLQRVLLGKNLVDLYESIQEFIVAEEGGEIVGFGALHVMWEDLAEVRTLAVAQSRLGTGLGSRLLRALIQRARELELERVFCLTFETEFFERHGFTEMDDAPLDPEIYAELLRSTDDGVAEFLDLARVKPNTLGNTRMILDLTASSA